MSAYLKKGIGVWILGFITFLAALNAVNAAILWALGVVDFSPYLISNVIDRMEVEIYFWLSATLTFIFLGFTAVAATRKPPLDPALARMFVKLDENLTANRKTLKEGLEDNKGALENARMDLLDGLDVNRKANEKLLSNIGTEVMSGLEEHGKIIRKIIQSIREELLSAIETSFSSTKKETLDALEKQRGAIQKVQRLHKRSVETIEKQMAELAEVRTRLETMEKTFIPSQPKLTSLSKPEDVKGIGPRLAEELRAMGITSVGELITADPVAIDEKTRVSLEMAKQLQATAQLMMIPGVDEKDAELLKEADVFSIKELAEQDPIQLSARIGEIAKTHVEQGKITESEKPTIEEILSWVKHAKY